MCRTEVLKAYNFLQKRIQHMHFPVKFAKCLRTPILKNTGKDSGTSKKHEEELLSQIVTYKTVYLGYVLVYCMVVLNKLLKNIFCQGLFNSLNLVMLFYTS